MKNTFNKQSGATTVVAILYLLVIITGIIGWISNIVKLAGCDFSQIGGEIVLRIVGIFVAPLGSVMGLFVGHF